MIARYSLNFFASSSGNKAIFSFSERVDKLFNSLNNSFKSTETPLKPFSILLNYD
jgi:hypothetical protein